MSSFVGHTITSIGICVTSKQPERLTRLTGLWFGWLAFVGLAPDLDYFIPALRSDHGLRVTHSLAGCLVIPFLTILVLSRLELKWEILRLYSVQICLAGLSHLAMDLLVGVWPLPLFWPFTLQVFRLPFGILPSAPSFQVSNYYMYRNVLIEIGVLVPLYVGVYLARFSQLSAARRYSILLLLGFCSLGFMYWAYTLAR